MADATTTHRDDVLVAFHAACPRPTAEDLALWIDRNPDLADDLRDHAEALLADVQARHIRREPSSELRTQATALGALDAASARATGTAPSPR